MHIVYHVYNDMKDLEFRKMIVGYEKKYPTPGQDQKIHLQHMINSRAQVMFYSHVSKSCWVVVHEYEKKKYHFQLKLLQEGLFMMNMSTLPRLWLESQFGWEILRYTRCYTEYKLRMSCLVQIKWQ
jgi:hypothetical protein